MSSAPLPPNERDRLETLGRYAILDTLPEQQFDDLTFLAAQICGTSISLISLVDRDRQWFKSHFGLEVEQTPRELSFCAHAILSDGVMEVPNATEDQRFADNALVQGEPQIRFYAGAPLVTPDGYKMGTLCVIDQSPRHLTEYQMKALEALARQAMGQMELWRTVRRLEAADQARQQALSHLAANAALLRQFVEHAPAAIAMLDRDMQFIALSRRFLTDYRLSQSDLTGANYYKILPDVPPHWKEAHGRVLKGAIERCEVDEWVRADGETEFLQWEMRPWRDARGQIGGIIILTEVISERVRANRIKNEFVSVVSHELRTPLTSIRGALGLLAGGVVGELPQKARDMIEIARKNSDRLVLLINDILDIEKIESGKMRFEMKPLAIRLLLENALDANRAYADELGARLELEMKDLDAQIEVLGDENRLQQVLSNLLSNACKFTPSGGAVRLQADSLQEKDALWLRITVSDEGPGVPTEFVPRLFEKFAQADSSSTRKQGGTGLGLAIARAIVEKHGGRMDYSPPLPGEVGARFFFTVPATKKGICKDEPRVSDLQGSVDRGSEASS
jgi:PAS domain S-box-containing protein